MNDFRIVTDKVGGEYNKLYFHRWRTSTNTLPMTVMGKINVITEGRRWGWTFIPHENMDWGSPVWYKDQTLVLSFEHEFDLIQSKLEVSNLLVN